MTSQSTTSPVLMRTRHTAATIILARCPSDTEPYLRASGSMSDREARSHSSCTLPGTISDKPIERQIKEVLSERGVIRPRDWFVLTAPRISRTHITRMPSRPLSRRYPTRIRGGSLIPRWFSDQTSKEPAKPSSTRQPIRIVLINV